VDLLPFKTCSLDCIYCECGPTTRLTTRRARFVAVEDVLAQVERRLAELATAPDFITLAGSGEPSLHLDLGGVIAGLKKLGPRVAVLTNSTLCTDPTVRRELALADVLVPSLDAVSDDAFRRVNRPAPGLSPGAIIQGLIDLRREFAGQMWLEILLVEGINDGPKELAALVEACQRIGPDLVQLNTVIRPPARAEARPLSRTRLEDIAAAFSLPVAVSAPPTSRAQAQAGETAGVVVAMTRRRPCTLEDIAAHAGLDLIRAGELVAGLVAEGRLTVEPFQGMIFYRGGK
jgi:wyosine [tRNA(Phe)-imidazoG37] synthetase (radical SAM superfamily)